MKIKILNIAAVVSTVVLLSVVALIVSNHLQELAELTVQKNLVKHIAKIPPENKNDISGKNVRPDSQVYGYSKPDRDSGKKISPEIYEKPGNRYASQPSAAGSPEISNEKVRDENKYEYNSPPYAEVPGQSVITKGTGGKIKKFPAKEIRSGAVGYSSKSNSLEDDVIENYEDGLSDEPGQEQKQEEEKESNGDPNYSVSVSREVQSVAFDRAVVILSVYINNESPKGLIVNEHLPAGWEILESTPPYRSFNPSTGEIKWLFIGSDVTNMKINYRLVKSSNSAAGFTFNGNYFYNSPEGERMAIQIDGENGV